MQSLRKYLHLFRRVVLIPFYVLLSFLWRVRYDSSWVLHGVPFIRRGGRGSRISIGKRLVACSDLAQNAIGVFQRVVIRTCADNAVIEIGDDVGMSGCVISACSHISIGSHALIGSGVLITDSDSHSLHWRDRREGGRGLSNPVVIEDDVFIGARAIVLKGVHIGRGAVVGAGSVVTRDVQAGSVVAGNPARVVREGLL